MSIDYKSRSSIHRNIRCIRDLDNSLQKVYSCLDSRTIQSPGKLSALPSPPGDGHEATPLEGIGNEASKGFLSPFGGFCFSVSQAPRGLPMNSERAKRKLSAILSADVKGYSRLMGEDEVGTVRTLKEHREVMSKLISEYRGRVVDSPGDNLLAEFASVVDAVESAIEIQRQLKAKNAELPEKRRMEFRIGINLGDVIEEGERIYGDGVNVAARMEGLALPGGVCVSGTAYDHVENKVAADFEYMGEQAVKNIRKPVRVYRVRRERGVPDIATKQEATAPAVPSIAVLPFVNMSGDPEQEYFSDGITEEIITGLSKIPRMHVIARNSTFVYKGRPSKVQQVGQELGVRYVLEGSVRKAGKRIRVTAQLIDVNTGYHLWAERYERELSDIFAVQDAITMKILSALQVELTEGEQARIRHEEERNLEAWGYTVKAGDYLERVTKHDLAKARGLLEQALALDPEYVSAWTGLSLAHWFDARFGWGEAPEESFKQAYSAAQKALSLDDSDPVVHGLMGCIHLYLQEYDQAIREAERAIALGPNHALVHALTSHILRFSGDYERAIAMIRKAMRLQPFLPSWYLMELSMSYYCIGRYEEAKDSAEQFRRLVENRGDQIAWAAYLMLAMDYIRLGREREARLAVLESTRLNPEYTLEVDRRYSCYRDLNIIERQQEDLRKAGLR
jgi:adenylate cyclase